MIKNDDTLRNIKQRIVTSKGEFSVNIFFRLKWVMYVENKYIDLEESFLLYNENAKRLRNHINVGLFSLFLSVFCSLYLFLLKFYLGDRTIGRCAKIIC